MSVCAGCGAELPPNLAPSPPRKWCSERCRKRQYQRPCEACGKPCGGSDKSRFCATCGPARGVTASRERSLAHRAVIERLWAEGYTQREITEITGSTTTISTLRSRGYNLPHRRTPEQLAHMTAGADERLAKARAVRRERSAA